MENSAGHKRNALRVNLVGEGTEIRGEVKQALSALAEPALEIIESDPHAGAAVSPSPDVSMVLFDGNEELSLACLQRQAVLSPRPVLFALFAARSPGLMKRAIRAGADELLSLPLDSGDLAGALLKTSEARMRPERRDARMVCSLSSVVGGTGVTTLACNLALALRYCEKRRVALLDLDLQSGGLAITLNLEPEVSIAPLVRLDRKLDSIQLESALTKHSSGLYLLAAPKRIEEGELVSDLTVAAVLDLMKEMFDFVIVDCGTHIDENTVAAWERSHHLLYVLNQSVVSLRSAWRFIDLFERLGLSTVEPRYLLNRYHASHAIGARQIENTLGRKVSATIPCDARAIERAELSGEDLWQVAAGSSLVRTFEQLARGLARGAESEVASRGSFVSRLFSAFGPRT